MKHMRFTVTVYLPLLVLFLAACGTALPPGHNPEPASAAAVADPGAPLGLFAIKASNGRFVSCSMVPDSSGKVTLFANREKVGPNEVFTAWYDQAGHMGIMAPNGRYITVERDAVGLLVADRDYVGEWEFFELIDQGDGLFALKNSNGRFVCPHYELQGAAADQLRADRDEPHEWERFTILRDPAIGQQ